MTTRLRIEPFDPHDDAQLDAFHEVGRRAETEDGRPWNAYWTPGALRGLLREPTADHRLDGFRAVEDGQLVAIGLVEIPLLDNVDKGWVFVAVDPERRGRGIGSTLLEHLVQRVRDHGRREVLAEAAIPVSHRDGGPALRFAARHGFAHHNTEVVRVLRLPLPPGLLDEVTAETAGFHEDYAIETYVDDLPEHHLAAYTRLRNQLGTDAPTGDVDFEEARTTPEIQAERLARSRRAGLTTTFSLAVLDGEAVAHSDLFTVAGDERSHQLGTLVRRDHRGHRLGTAVKVASLRSLQQTRPDVTEVITQNAETNDAMVAINVRLGFDAVGLVAAFVRRLT